MSTESKRNFVYRIVSLTFNLSESKSILQDIIFSDVTSNEVKNKEIIVGIVTDIDLLHYVTRKEQVQVKKS
jgi:hypothetical protein